MKKQIFVGLFALSIFFTATVFGQNDKKNTYGILLDNTASLRTQFDYVKNLGKAVVREIGDNSSIALFNFETIDRRNIASGKIGLSWEKDEEVIDNYVEKLQTTYGRTNLSHAIFLASNVVNSRVGKQDDNLSEKILILITDGEEHTVSSEQKKLIKYLKENQIKVYAIALTDELKTKELTSDITPEMKARYFLNKLTQETGGRAIFPKEKQTVEEIIKDLFVGINK